MMHENHKEWMVIFWFWLIDKESCRLSRIENNECICWDILKEGWPSLQCHKSEEPIKEVEKACWCELEEKGLWEIGYILLTILALSNKTSSCNPLIS